LPSVARQGPSFKFYNILLIINLDDDTFCIGLTGDRGTCV
jgi:hypothetical protein